MWYFNGISPLSPFIVVSFCRQVFKGLHTRNDNLIQSSESQVNLCMYGIIVLPKVVDFSFDRVWSTSESKLMIVACMEAFTPKLPAFCKICRLRLT